MLSIYFLLILLFIAVAIVVFYYEHTIRDLVKENDSLKKENDSLIKEKPDTGYPMVETVDDTIFISLDGGYSWRKLGEDRARNYLPINGDRIVLNGRIYEIVSNDSRLKK